MKFVEVIKARLAALALRAPYLADPREGVTDLANIVADLVNGPPAPEAPKEPEAAAA